MVTKSCTIASMCSLHTSIMIPQGGIYCSVTYNYIHMRISWERNVLYNVCDSSFHMASFITETPVHLFVVQCD